MTEHALDAMIYAWMVMKEKEENKMEGIFLGQAVDGVFSIDKTKLTFEDDSRTHESHSTIRYSDCDYVLVESDDVIKTNDELLKLRDEVKRLTEACNGWEAECNDWKARYAKVNNELFQKGLAYGTLEEEYKKEKIAGELLLKDRNTLREDRDTWKRRWNSVVTDIGKSLEANGITFVFKEIHGNGNWDVVIDIPELNEAKKKVDDLEKKLKAAESKETFWRDRKEEEEDYHHYWLHTYDRVVKQAAEKGIHIGVRGNDEECNAGIVVVDNVKAEELEKQVVQMEDANQKLRQRISAADEEIEKLKNREGIAYWRNTYYSAVKKAKAEGVTIVMQGMDFDRNVAHIKVMNHRTANLERRIKRLEDDVVAAKDRGDYWKRSYDDLAEYWNNTRKDLVARGKTVGVKIEFKGDKSDSNVGDFDITNEKTIELMVKVSDTKHEYNKKWQAMFDALKDKGIEVIYMGEEDEKPIIDVKIPKLDELKRKVDVRARHIDILKKKLETLKSRTLDNVEIRLSCGDIVWTYCDGFVHVSSGIDGIISADQITNGHINCLCKNHFDAESVSHGTIPKCSSCAHYMHNPSPFTHDWCYMPIPKEGGSGYIRKLNKEESEGPACSNFKARKE